LGINFQKKQNTGGFEFKEHDYVTTSDFDDLSSRPYNYDYTATVDLDSGSIISYTSNSITDTSKNWETDVFIDKVVKLTSIGGEDEYCIISSNTNNTLTFDCNISLIVFATYRIFSTFLLEKMSSVVSFDIRDNCCALILPLVSTVENRKSNYIYNELASNGSHKLVVIARGLDRIRGVKSITLEHQWEAVELYAHYREPKHWDILNVENVKRYISATVTNNVNINSLTYAPVLIDGSSTTISAKRFIAKTISGIRWAKYMSVVSNEFLCTGNISLNKTSGGFSVIEFTIRVKRFNSGLTEDYTDVATIARLSNGQIVTVPIHIPFVLYQYDEVTAIAKNNDGLVLLETGTIFTIREY